MVGHSADATDGAMASVAPCRPAGRIESRPASTRAPSVAASAIRKRDLFGNLFGGKSTYIGRAIARTVRSPFARIGGRKNSGNRNTARTGQVHDPAIAAHKQRELREHACQPSHGARK